VGTEFDYIARSFGWVNASYQIGLQIIDLSMKEKLNQLVSPDELF
jgi:alpha,alpha-trehalase